MAKNKLFRFSQINSFPNVVQPGDRYPCPDHELRGNWCRDYFSNNHPIVLEIGCGKGEYTLGLAQAFAGKNFIGIDIKGDRLWKGAKAALQLGLQNVAFLRIQAERINHFFAENEVSEIWITFPDPQLQETRKRKRLTGPEFLERYSRIINNQGIIHLKTDNRFLFDFTLETIREANHHLLAHTFNLYADDHLETHGLKDIQTHYETKYLQEGLPIHYLQFRLNK